MRESEATWIRDALSRIDVEALSPVLELGSATTEFRTVSHPHVNDEIHVPLKRKGVTIVTSDIKAGDGVDISGDIYEMRTQDRLRAVGARTVLCCNIFEHVEDRGKFAAICDELLAPGGYMIVTVPHSYPYHLDPIDTMFRPTIADIGEMFPRYEIVEGHMIVDSTYGQDLLREHGWAGAPIIVAKLAGKLLLPMGGIEKWKSRNHRLLWFFKPYETAGVLLRKPLA